MKRRPAPASHLDAVAAAKWHEVLPLLPDQETTTLDLLTAYAAAWSRMIQAEGKVQELGPVIKSPQGFPVGNPYLSIVERERRAVRQLAAELRLTPASRGKANQAKTPLQILRTRRRRA